MIYDESTGTVLLMIIDAAGGGWWNAQEERYRLAAALHRALLSEKETHHFECSGTPAESFFDPKEGIEKNYYGIMAPLRLRSKSQTNIDIPLSAFRPFTKCPPRYFIVNKSIRNAGLESAFSPFNFAHVGLNKSAIHLLSVVSVDYVEKNILPRLINNSEEDKSYDLQPSQRLTSRTRLSENSPYIVTANNKEEEEELNLETPQDLLDGLCGWLLKRRELWTSPGFICKDVWNEELKTLSSTIFKEGHMQTPLEVFDNILAESNGVEKKRVSSVAFDYSKRSSQLSDISTNRVHAIQSQEKVYECGIIEG
ncbi:unnamed protein product [Phytomonas sp. Hart1]|nr:unnamed protein product [Phytomonas sp. Hart1]|eukprot:CCW69525.1 unnamed protein product [Phytomonas sp. isolate Hart1]